MKSALPKENFGNHPLTTNSKDFPSTIHSLRQKRIRYLKSSHLNHNSRDDQGSNLHPNRNKLQDVKQREAPTYVYRMNHDRRTSRRALHQETHVSSSYNIKRSRTPVTNPRTTSHRLDRVPDASDKKAPLRQTKTT